MSYLFQNFRLCIIALISLLLVGGISPARAQFYKNTGVNEASGIPYLSLTILSDSKQAALTFICDEGAIYPRITFKRQEEIQKVGDAFMLRYINDQGIEDKHNFLTLKGGNIGRFFIRHTQLYAARFGKQPTMFKPGTATFSSEYINWDAHIRQTVLHDLVDGEKVDVTIWDRQKTAYDYHSQQKAFQSFPDDW